MGFPLASNKNRCWRGVTMVTRELLTVKTMLLLMSLIVKLSLTVLSVVIIKSMGCVAEITNQKKKS